MVKELILFLRDNYFMLVYGLAFILSVIKYKYFFDTHLKALPILIAYVLLTEFLGYLIKDFEEIQIVYEKGFSHYNHFIYNLLDIVFFLYFFRIYKKSISDKNHKKLIGYGVITFLIVTAINPFFQNFMLYPQLAAITLGSVLLIASTLFYFKETGLKQSQFSNYNLLLWWISLGILIFYPFYPIIMSIGQINEMLFFNLHLRSILLCLIIAMYSCFLIGLIKLKKVHFLR